MTEKRDKLGRSRRASQGGAGPKNLPTQTGGSVTGQLHDADMPTDLGEHGSEFWLAATESMRALGILERADRMVLRVASGIWQRMHDAEATLEAEGHIILGSHGKVRHPAMVTKEKAEAALLRYLSDLGLTPSARAKFGQPAGDDPFEALMRAN